MSKTYKEWDSEQKRRIQDTYTRGRQGERDKYQNTVDSLYLEHDAAEQLAQNNYDSALGTAGAKRDATHASATETRDLSYKEAERRLHAQKSEAQDSFTRSQVTYGQAAERLGQAGLTGTGLSDNLTRDVYAQRQEAVGAANAQYGVARDAADRLYSETTRAADITYADETGRAELDFKNAGVLNKATLDKGLLDAELSLSQGMDKVTNERDTAISALDLEGVKYGQEAAASYAELMAGIKDGSYGASDIDTLTKTYGYSDEEVNALRTELTNRQTTASETVKNEIRSSLTTPNEDGDVIPSYTLSDIDSLARNGTITPEMANELKKEQESIIKKALTDALSASYAITNKNSGEGKKAIENVKAALEDLNVLYENGYISMDAFNEAVHAYNEWVTSYVEKETVDETPYNVNALKAMGNAALNAVPATFDAILDSAEVADDVLDSAIQGRDWHEYRATNYALDDIGSVRAALAAGKITPEEAALREQEIIQRNSPINRGKLP